MFETVKTESNHETGSICVNYAGQLVHIGPDFYVQLTGLAFVELGGGIVWTCPSTSYTGNFNYN
jgi:hypothetical protein